MQKLLPLLAGFLLAALSVSGQRIPITPAQITGSPTAAASFDGNTSTAWFPGWSANLYPARCTVTLDQPHRVSKIRVFDGTGATTFRAYADGREVLAFPLALYQTWQEHRVEVTARVWVFEMESALGDMQCPEIELYGKPDGEGGPVEPPPVPPAGPCACCCIGSNTFPWVPLDKSLPLLRVYISSGWIVTDAGLFIEPMKQAQTPGQGFGLDTYLAAAKAAGADAYLCIHQTPEWYIPTGRDDGANDHFPVKPGRSRFAASSYADYAGWMGQVTKRYGRKTWPAAALRVDARPRWNGDPPNVAKSGLDLLDYLEPWNEEKWWKIGGPEYVEPEAMAAMMSAVYDSVKASDPTMMVVMPGLSGFDLNYLQKMDEWFVAHGRAWACDILNVHHYSNRGNRPGQWPPTWYSGGAVAPELDADFVTFAAVVQFARSRGLAVWCTEFGYDTQATPDGSNLSWQYPMPMPVPGKTAEQLQADWLVRSYLEYMRLGCDRMFMFNSVDEPGYLSGGLYQSSGLLGSQATGYKPKPSFAAVSGLIRALDGFNYAADRSTPTVRVLEFTKGRTVRYFYWSPTADGRTASAVVAGRVVTAREDVQYFDTVKRRRLFALPKNATGKAVAKK